MRRRQQALENLDEETRKELVTLVQSFDLEISEAVATREVQWRKSWQRERALARQESEARIQADVAKQRDNLPRARILNQMSGDLPVIEEVPEDSNEPEEQRLAREAAELDKELFFQEEFLKEVCLTVPVADLHPPEQEYPSALLPVPVESEEHPVRELRTIPLTAE